MEDRKPNWDKWKLIPTWSALEAVALSLDIDPTKVNPYSHGWMGAKPLFNESQDFNDRLEILSANLNKNELLPIKVLSMDSEADCKTTRDGFVKWATSEEVNWAVPSELSLIAKKARSETKQSASINPKRDLMIAKMGVAGADAY